MDKFAVKGKTVVLTGAARGLGLVFSDLLASAGANIVVLNAGDPGDQLDQIAAKHSVRTAFYRTDETRRDEVAAAVAAIEQTFGRVDIKYHPLSDHSTIVSSQTTSVNGAGVVKHEPFLSTTDTILASTFFVNASDSNF